MATQAYSFSFVPVMAMLRRLRFLFSSSIPVVGAYQLFLRQLVTEFLLWQRRVVDEYLREDQFVTHNFDYYLNYSGTEQTLSCPHPAGASLLDGRTLGKNEGFTLAPWGFLILES